jgi:penicillin-binding protein 2
MGIFAHVIGYVGINDKELKSIDKDLYAGTNLIGKIGGKKRRVITWTQA